MSDHRYPRPPGDAGGFAAVEGFHHHAVGGFEADAFAGADHAVLDVAGAGQPDAAGQHGQFTGAMADAPRLAGEESLAEAVQGRQGAHSSVRNHHQSP
jgi:hypothetical protein